MRLIEELEKSQLKSDIPDFKPGDTVLIEAVDRWDPPRALRVQEQ